MDDDEAILNFSRLVLLGKLRQAIRFLTDRAAHVGVLQAKHPNQADAHPNAFIACSELPELIDIDVTADHELKVTSSLSEGASERLRQSLQTQL